MAPSSNGRGKAQLDRPGRYLLEVSHAEAGRFDIGGRPVGKLHHVSTLAFSNP